mmetsp:Transcript_27017/g.80973  ORF Transcript_27017/g.80973 Transcript_27017/m.80973 type:complete len:219 (-) Transcript_27017:47-703(-)
MCMCMCMSRIDRACRSSRSRFYSKVFGKKSHPLRTTATRLPKLLSTFYPRRHQDPPRGPLYVQVYSPVSPRAVAPRSSLAQSLGLQSVQSSPRPYWASSRARSRSALRSVAHWPRARRRSLRDSLSSSASAMPAAASTSRGAASSHTITPSNRGTDRPSRKSKPTIAGAQSTPSFLAAAATCGALSHFVPSGRCFSDHISTCPRSDRGTTPPIAAGGS